MNKERPQINIIIPLFNEEEVFETLIARVGSVMDNSDLKIEVILVDDGSVDNTPTLMHNLSSTDSRYSSVFLSRNFGHQIALSAGFSQVNSTECVFVIDGDLQDPPELLPELYDYYKKGYDVVYAIRKKRKEGILKKLAYNAFYRILRKFSNIHIPLDSGDFSLVSRRVVDQLNKMPEESRFIRGMRSWVGYKQIGVEYERSERHKGNSKYSLKLLISLALNGIFNFSEYPIKIISWLGIGTIALSSSYLLYSFIMRLLTDSVPDGFTALLFVIILFGGMQLVAIGVIGEYILRIFFQVKQRPLFVISGIMRDSKMEENG